MSLKPMDLYVSQEHAEYGTRRIMLLENIRDLKKESLSIYFDMPDEYNLPQPGNLDGFIFGIIFFAMQIGQNIQVHGAVSRDCLRNLNEFQEAWISWRPNIYKKVSIIPDSVVDNHDTKVKDEAIAAFSGGVDSIFSVLRHTSGQLGFGSYPVHDSVILVHGFDVPLIETEQFEKLRIRISPFLKELNLKIRTLRTNLKELNLQDWEDSFSSQLSCCMHNYSHEFKFGIIGSSEPYNGLVLPWGSNPATDYLLSGSTFRIVHDGAGFSRTQKIEEIAKNKVASRIVKVCWKGKETYKNCGVCEKCLRTRLNFLAIGEENPACFETPFDLKLIKTIKLKNKAQCAELKSIIDYVKNKGIKASWIKKLQKVIIKFEHPSLIKRFIEKIKSIAIKKEC